jgi:hypothetical protein
MWLPAFATVTYNYNKYMPANGPAAKNEMHPRCSWRRVVPIPSVPMYRRASDTNHNTKLLSGYQAIRPSYTRLSSYTRLYQAIPGYTKLYQAIPSYTKYQAIPSYTKLYQTDQSYTKITCCRRDTRSRVMRWILDLDISLLDIGDCTGK